MPITCRLLALLCLCAPMLGCGDDQDPSGAKALWTKLQDTKYQTWARAPGYETRKPSDAPHSDNVDIFVNDVVENALAGPDITRWPDGSLLAKDGYDDGGTLEIVAAMEKRSGTWFWAEWEADGTSLYSGNPNACTGCHSSGADLVRAFGFPPP